MRVQVRKWGNSLALRIPKPFAEDVAVREGTMVDVTLSDGKLILAPVRVRKKTLKELLKRMHRRNLHGEADSGPPVGRESW